MAGGDVVVSFSAPMVQQVSKGCISHPAGAKGEPCNGSALDGVPLTSPLLNGSSHDEPAASSRRLVWYDELPAVLQYNRYVRSGYRAGYTCGECACSILQYHNETGALQPLVGNIHCHLLPALLLAAAVLGGWLRPWPGAVLAWTENVLPIFLCFCGSVTYHTFMANHWQYRRWILIDVAGVFLLLLGGVHMLMYWGLYCYPAIRNSFLTAYYLTAAGAVVAGLSARSNIGRAAPMLVLFLVRVACLGVRIVLNAGSHAAVVHYALAEAFCFAGALVNVLRLPERWVHDFAAEAKGVRVAGTFDYWLNSHQLMHLCVTAAMLNLHLGASDDYHHFSASGGACPQR